MGGVDIVDGELVVDREPNRLDDLALGFSTLLQEEGIAHVFVSGYVAILTGRSRATQDIVVLIESIDEATATALVNRLGVKPRGFPWFNRTLPRYHRSDDLERSSGSRSGRPRPPMPAVAPSALGEGC